MLNYQRVLLGILPTNGLKHHQKGVDSHPEDRIWKFNDIPSLMRIFGNVHILSSPT
jgi:hypothetical protein